MFLNFKGALPRYYHGESCKNYWLCFDGYQYPMMACPSDLEYNHYSNGCIDPELNICPADELDGLIKQDLILPERIVHKSCGYRHKNGTYTIHEERSFMTDELCGYKQV